MVISLLVVLAACRSGPQRLDDAIRDEAREPLDRLPLTAPLYFRATASGLREAQTLYASVEEREDALRSRLDRPQTVAGPALLLAVEKLLSEDLSTSGHDASRPLFGALLDSDSEAVARAAALGVPAVEAEVPLGFHSVVVLPATNTQALEARVRQWWTQQEDLAQRTQHRVSAANGWVRLDVFAPRPEIAAADAQRALEQAIQRSSSGGKRRMTPALAAFLTERADGALYIAFDRVRSFGAADGSVQMFSALRNVEAEQRATVLRGGGAELARQWQLMDPSAAEFEDLAVWADITPDKSARLDGIATLTAAGRRIYAARGADAKLPKVGAGEFIADLRISGDFVGMSRAAPVPRVLQLEEGREEDVGLRELLDESGAVGFVALVRAPFAFAHALGEELDTGFGLRTARVLQLRVMGADERMLAQEEALPRALAMVRFGTAQEADEVLGKLRETIPPAIAGMIRVDRITAGPEGASIITASFNADPAALLVSGQEETVPAGIHLTVGKGAQALLSRARLESPDSVWHYLEQGPMELNLEPAATTFRLRARIGAPAETAQPASLASAESVEPAFDAISLDPTPEEDCRFEISRLTTRAVEASAYAQPDDARTILASAISELGSGPACVKTTPKVAEDAAFARTRLEQLRAEMPAAPHP